MAVGCLAVTDSLISAVGQSLLPTWKDKKRRTKAVQNASEIFCLFRFGLDISLVSQHWAVGRCNLLRIMPLAKLHIIYRL